MDNPRTDHQAQDLHEKALREVSATGSEQPPLKADFSMPKLIGVIAGVSILTFGITKFVDNHLSSSSKIVSETNSSEVLEAPKSLARLGLDVIESFEVDGVKGHGLLYQGQPVIAYEIPGTSHVVIGDLISHHGTNFSQIHQQDYVMSHIGERSIPLLEDSHYVIDSDNRDGVVMYTLTDPHCLFCLRLWETLKPHVEAGDIQVRHVLVGIRGEQSLMEAAAILESDSPHDTLHQYLSNKSLGEEYALPEPSNEAIQKILENNATMRSVGASGTPASYVQYPDGSTEFISGAFGAEMAFSIVEKYKKMR